MIQVQELRDGITTESLLKKGIWAYFLLLIFEGALRKWFLPGLATSLLVVRDPIALFLIWKAFQKGILLPNPLMTGSILIGIISIYTSLLLGHGSIPVAIYGARLFLIYFPLMFVIGSVFNAEDVVKVGKITLLISIPMIILVGLQFYSPQSAWVNRGVGGDMEGAGFSGAMGYERPPGTFSFTNGLTLFFSFAAAYLVYFWYDSQRINKVLLVGATLALLVAIPLSISRSLFFSTLVTMMFGFIITLANRRYLPKTLGVVAGLVLLLTLLSQTSVFQLGTEVFMARFDSANRTEGGVEGVLLGRYLGGLVGAVSEGAAGGLPFFGYGIGMGTNVGSMLLTNDTTFLIAEGEWARVIGEIGFFLGFLVILIRLLFSFKIALESLGAMLQGNVLPWMLLSFALLIIPQGQWAQPTAHGFSTLIGGLVIASFNEPFVKQNLK